MIFFWDKAEVYIGYSLQEFNATRDILHAAKIESTYQIKNHEGSSRVGTNRSRTGSSGIKSGYTDLYLVYVHKRQRDAALTALEKRR